MARSQGEYIGHMGMEDLVRELESKLLQWPSSESGSQILRAWINTYWRNLQAYYNPILETASPATSLGFGGSQGELVQTIIPLARTHINNLSPYSPVKDSPMRWSLTSRIQTRLLVEG